MRTSSAFLATLGLLLGAGLVAPGPGVARAPGRPGLAGGAPGGVARAPLKKGSGGWKRNRPARRLPRIAVSRPGQAAAPVITLRNLHTGEVLAVPGGPPPAPALVNRFLRCRWTARLTAMEPRLIPWVLEAALHFGAREVQVVSAFRHPKFNEVLRKKGHEVARQSNHRLGKAIDFRLVGVDVAALFAYLKGRRLGGIGRYPHSQFVHLDTGRFRTWGGR